MTDPINDDSGDGAADRGADAPGPAGEREQRALGRLSRRGFLGASTAAAALLPVLDRKVAEARGAPAAKPNLLGPGAVALSFQLNGKPVATRVEPRETLAEVLLYRLDMTGTKIACDRGACGACTVLIDGKTRSSCMTPALDVEGRSVVTIEGVAPDAKHLHTIQAAFVEKDGLQCGYCTPGFVMSAHALLSKNPAPTRADVADALSGNLCRCGSHPHVIDAVLAAAGQPSKGGGR